jgi:hypothetical protein
MSEAADTVRGLAGALERHDRRATAAEQVVFPRQRDDDQTPPIEEPTGQHAVVVNAAGGVFVRLEHRWWQAGVATTEPVLWPDIHATAVKSWGAPE